MLPAAAGYFLVWTLLGAAVYPLGAAATAAAKRYEWVAGAAPVVLGAVVLIAGVLQLTGWKARHLAHCRGERRRESLGSGRVPRGGVLRAWSHGLRLGLHCSQSCAGLTGVLLVAGVMDMPAMLAVTAAITLERLAPAGERIARLVGIMAVGAGVLLTLRAAVLP
jgi:predicted metal-binding membrane protein